MPADFDDAQGNMLTVSKHSKVKLEVKLDSRCFEAGGAITGRIELTSATSQKLRLGDIAVELEGIEGETIPDCTSAVM